MELKRDQIHLGQISQDAINQQAQAKLQNELDEANQKVDESVNKVRDILPKSKEDYSNLMEEQPGLLQRFTHFWQNNPRDYRNNKSIELLGLDTKEGLNQYFHSLDPNDENLRELMNQLGVKSVDDLASNYELQASINLVGGGNWYYPDLSNYTGKLGEYGDFTSTGSREVGNLLIKIVNSKYAKDVGEIPLKSASNEEIISYIDCLSKDQTKMNALATYTGIQSNDFGALKYIKETWDDYESWSKDVSDLTNEINKYQNNGMNLSEIQEAVDDVSKLANQYNEAEEIIKGIEKKSVGYMTGVKSEISANPLVIGGAGAAAGASLGMATESKNIFKKAKEYLRSKLFGRNKNKALPSGEQIDVEKEKEAKLEEKRKKLNVELDSEQLDKIESISEKSKEIEEKKQADRQEDDERED